MSDYQQIVDEIRFALQSEDCELTEELRAAAREYSLACHEVNQRLRKIGTYLDSGLRSEAIQLAEGPPSIEEVVGVLNFPELDAWTDVVAVYDLPRNEPLNLQVVDSLYEAQFLELPLQNLLSRHRLLALHRAPLRMRLGVLRKLRAADLESLNWDEDVRLFEKARFQEIAEELRSAQKQGNLTHIKQLLDELSGDDWTERPPAKLTQAIRNAAAELTKKGAHLQLEELAPQLEQAFSELDFPKAKSLAIRWKEALRRTGQGENAPLVQQVAPILAWVQDEEDRDAAERQYQQLSAKLEHELDQSGNIEELDRLVHEIVRLDREVPELLAIRYQNRRESVQITQARTHRLQLGSVLAVIVAVVAGIAFLVQHQMKVAEAERFAAQVENLLDNKQYEEARGLLSKRDDITSRDRLVAVQARLEKEVKEAADRQMLFSNAIALARAATTHKEAMSALEQAHAHATSPQDKIAASEIQREWERKRDQEVMTRESALGESIQHASEELKRLDHEMGTGPGSEEVGQALVQLASWIGDLQKQSQGLRPEFASQLRLLSARRKELEDLRRQRLVYQQCITDLTLRAQIPPSADNPIQAVDRFRISLLAFADALSQQQQQSAAMYREREAEDPYWKAAMFWSEQTGKWQDVWPQDLTEVSRRIKICRDFVTSHPGAPDAALAKRYADQLGAFVSITGQVDGGGSGLTARLDRIFSSPLVEKSWCLRINDGRIFYLPDGSRVSTSGIPNFKFYVGYGKDDLDTQKKVAGDKISSPTPTPSPSQNLAIYVKKQLQNLPADQWNAFCLELSEKILDDQELHPFLKLDLLKRSLELSSNGDLFLKEQLEPHLKFLQAASINPLARWMNPDDAEGKRASDDARQILTHFQRLKTLGEVWKYAGRQRDEFSVAMRQSVSMVGWLQPGEEWTFHIQDREKLDHCDLAVIHIPIDSKAGEWKTIGRLERGKLDVDGRASGFLAAGRPIFAIQQASSPSVSGQPSTAPKNVASGSNQ